MTKTISFLLFALLFSVFAGCGGKNRTPHAVNAVPPGMRADAFHPYGPARAIVDSIPVDLNMDGIRELVVTSRDARDARDSGVRPLFDRVEVFRLDTARRCYVSIFVDPVESGASVTFKDLVRNGKIEVIVASNSGGNDPVSSRGLDIYGYHADGSFSVMFFAQTGDPQLEDLDGDGVPEVVVTGEYWGPLAHSDAVFFTESVHRFDGSSFVADNAEFAPYFSKEITARLAAYQRIRRQRAANADERDIALYRAAAEVVLWMESKGDLHGVRVFMDKEGAYLAGELPDDLGEDLQGLIDDIMTGAVHPDAPEQNHRLS